MSMIDAVAAGPAQRLPAASRSFSLDGPEFRLLGPVEVGTAAGVLHVGGERSRAILAALLLNAGTVVSIEQLVEAAWGPHPPASARVQIQNRVSNLRRTLPTRPAGGLIHTSSTGYLIRPAEGQLDLDRFTRLTAAAEHLLADGDPAAAVDSLVMALELRRGPALDGLVTPYLATAAHGIEERFTRALERRIHLELGLGRHAQLIGMLRHITQQHPYRERLHALLMLALFRDGRQAEALQAYRQARTVLVKQLGVEPGMLLQHLNVAILRADTRLLHVDLDDLPPGPALQPGAVTNARSQPRPGSGVLSQPPNGGTLPHPVPRELPPAVAGFVGRVPDLRALDAFLAGGNRMDPGDAGAPYRSAAATPPVLIVGAPGVGKTALAVRWAHRISGRFPDGQLHLDLRGYAPGPPMRPVDAVAALLRAIGFPLTRVPGDLAEAAARYRSMLADRRMLILLDNAVSAEQVRPLLPGSAGNLVIVTSRDRLSALVAGHDARRISLRPLPGPAARGLIERILGTRRAHADAGAIELLAEACGHLPLALRIAATLLADHPRRTVADLVAAIRADLGALALPGAGEVSVRNAVDWSYRSLTPRAQRLFGKLGHAAGESCDRCAADESSPRCAGDAFRVECARTFGDLDPGEAEAVLDELYAAHLMEECGTEMFTINGLLRHYAAQRRDMDDGR